MSTTIKLRRSAVPGRVPTTGQLELGEIAINTADGKLYYKRYDPVSNTESIIDASTNLDPDAILSLLSGVDGANSGLDADLLDGQEGTYYLDFTNFTNLPDPVLNVIGDVVGNTTFTDLGNATLTLELTDTGVTPGTYGSSSEVPVLVVDVDGRITSANTVTVAGVSDTYWTVANNTYTIETADGGVFNTVIDSFNDISANNITTTGLVNGRDIAADGAKLDLLEDGLDLTLTGKVTGTASSNTGVMTLVTELANTGVTAGSYGSSTAIPVITVDEDGRITLASTADVSGVENFSWTIANNTLTLETGDGTIYSIVLDTFSDITTNDITANNIIVNGLVDGRDIAADGAKLDLLEDGLDLTLTGKVTGFASSNTGVMTLVTELSNTGVTAGSYGSSTAIPVLTIDEDGRITLASTTSVAGVENFTWASANNTLTLETGDGSFYNVLLDEFSDITTNDITSNDITANNIIVSGLVDGRDIAADGAVLDSLAAATTTVNLTGKVTGSAVSNNGIIDITTELSNTGVTAGSYGSSTAIPVLTIDEDGRVTLASTASVAGVNDFYWTSSNNTLILETGDGSSYLVPIDTFTDITVNDLTANNIIVSGLVDGRDIAADGSKLDGIEPGATGDQTASEILALLLTVDGDGSGLDADSVDGYSAAEILDAAANNAQSLVGAGEVFIYANTGVTITGDNYFNLNSSNSHIIVVEHADTSSVTDVTNAGGIVIQDMTFDTFGHVQSTTSYNLDNRYYTETELDNGQLNTLYYTETELDNGQLDNRYYTETELDNGQLDNRYYTETEIDANFYTKTQLDNGQLDNRYYTETELDNGQLNTLYYTETELDNGQLDNRYYTETELDNGQLDNRYYTETELDNGQLDNRYYTETESDTRFVNVTGDTMSGELVVNANISQQHSTFISASATTTTTSQTPMYAFPYASFAGAEVLITATNGSNRHITKLLITHDGSTAIGTEYGTVYTSSELASYDITISGPTLQILVTPASSSSTTFKIVGTLIKV